MGADFLAGISQALLEKASAALFPKIKDKLGGTSTISNPSATISWGVTAAPTFSLSSAESQSFDTHVSLSVGATPEGGTKVTETVAATASTTVSINGAGKLGLHVADITFATSDPFLQAVLNAKKSDIGATIDSILARIEIPVGPVAGVTFHGYAAGVVNGGLYAAGSLGGPASIQALDTGSGFQVQLSEALVLTLVQTLWWNNPQTSKHFDAHGASVDLKSYSASVSNGQLHLNLSIGGRYSWGHAHWDLRVDTVHAKLDFDIKNYKELWIDHGSTNKPGVSLHPSNFWATIATIALGPVIAAIQLVIYEKLPGDIKDHLDRKVFTVPTLTETFEDVPITVTPSGISIKGAGSSLLLSGNAEIKTT